MKPYIDQYIIPITIVLIVVFYCLSVPLERESESLFPTWTKFIFAIPLILILTNKLDWLKWKNPSRSIFTLCMLIILYFSNDISVRLFLGKQVAYTYLGQDAGFQELYLFDEGRCKLTYGGIFGVHENHYGTFQVRDENVYVHIKAALLDLEGFTIDVNNKTLTILNGQ